MRAEQDARRSDEGGYAL